MGLIFDNTQSVREFANTYGVKKIVGNVWPDSGKHFLKTDNDIVIKVNEEAYQKFVSKDIDDLAISECSEGNNSFFMLHMKRDGYESEFVFTL